jgi:hypothetical protein
MTRQTTLLAALQRKSTVSQEATSATPTVEPALTPASRSRQGKAVQFWLHDEDRKIVRELSAWLAGQGIRPSDSMVIRAALRLAQPGGALMGAYRQAAQLDGRLRRNSTSAKQ